MSSKLTSKKLDELILEVLQEKEIKKISIKPANSWSDLKANSQIKPDWDSLRDTGIRGATGAGITKMVQDLADNDGDNSGISDIDFFDAFQKTGLQPDKKLANAFATNREKDYPFSKEDIQNIRSLATDKKKSISLDDYKTIRKADPSKNTFSDIKFADIEDIDVDKQKYEPEGIAFSQMANIGSQVSDPSQSSSGKYPEGLAGAVQSFLGKHKSFQARLKAISDFSKKVYDQASLSNMSATQVLGASLIMDFINTIAREVDAGASAYLFETAMATFAGGVVAGKGEEETEATKKSGQMGAVDFVMKGGAKGSSKFYGSVGKGKITQAISGFKGTQPVLYVIAHKKGDVADKTVTSGDSDPSKMLAINIYLVAVTPLIKEPKYANHFAVHVNGKKTNGGEISGGFGKQKTSSVKTLDISDRLTQGTPMTLFLKKDGGATFKQALENSTAKSGDQIKNAYKKFQSVFQNLYQANQKAQRYSSSGDRKQGNDALTAMQQADKDLIQLAAELEVIAGAENREQTVKDKAAQITKDREITENKKKSLKDLDKLIERVILDKMIIK